VCPTWHACRAAAVALPACCAVQQICYQAASRLPHGRTPAAVLLAALGARLPFLRGTARAPGASPVCIRKQGDCLPCPAQGVPCTRTGEEGRTSIWCLLLLDCRPLCCAGVRTCSKAGAVRAVACPGGAGCAHLTCPAGFACRQLCSAGAARLQALVRVQLAQQVAACTGQHALGADRPTQSLMSA
jgi:hypothetical protein